MASPDHIPQARIVRDAGRLVAPPPPPRSVPGPIVEQLRTAVGVAFGLWPLTGVLLLMFGLLYVAGMYSSP